ncbi:MAG: Mrp/NBP35 family ATP-binding protein [Acidimicrobiia bacterium]
MASSEVRAHEVNALGERQPDPSSTSPPGTDGYEEPRPGTSQPTEDEVRGSLRGVIDPELGSDVVDLGMVRSVSVGDDGAVVVTLALTTAGCPLRAQLQRDVRARVGSLPGVAKVDLEWSEMTPAERNRAMDRARFKMSQHDEATSVAPTTRVIAVASGKGGVGKSSVTVNLAAALADRGLKVGVLDADIWGFSVPRMLGVDGRLAGIERDGRKFMVPNERRIGAGLVRVVSMGFLVDDEGAALMWRGLMLNRGVQHFLQDVDWGDDLDYLLIDMPPGTGDVQMGVAKLVPRTDVLIVTTPALAAQKVAVRAASMARKNYLRIAGVVENMSAFTCAHGESYPVFGAGGGEACAREAGAPLLASIPIEPSVAAGGDTGTPVALGQGPAAEAFRALATRIVEEAVPPVAMAGCSARMLEAAVAALDG